MPPPFTIPYAARPSNYPSRISDLIRNQGEIQAQRASNSGAIWANTLGDIARGVSLIPQMKADAENRRAQADLRKKQGEREDYELAGLKRQDATAQARATAYSNPSRQQAIKMLQDSGDLEGLDKLMGSYKRVDDSFNTMLGEYAVGVREHGDTPEAAQHALQDLAEKGFDPAKLQQFAEQAQTPEGVKAMTSSMLRNSPNAAHQAMVKPKKLTEVSPNATLFDEDTQKPVFTAPAAPEKPVALQHVETAAGIQSYNPVTGELGPVIARGKPTAEATSRIWITRPSPDGTRQTLRVSEAEIRPGDQPASTREQGRKVTAGDAEDLAAIKDSQQDLATLRGTIGKTGAGSWLGTKVPDVATSLFGWGADSKSRQATIDRVKQVIGKALEGGVLRKEDEIKYEKILPKIGDVETVVNAKLDGLDAALKRKWGNRLDSLTDAGYDVSSYHARDEKNSKKKYLSTDPNAGEPIR